jgi:hypothetical protein
LKKVSLNEAAAEFEMISHDTHVFYNTDTGEFDFFTDFMLYDGEIDVEEFDDDRWIAAPRHDEIDEYGIMVDFAEAVPNQRKSELLCVALEGKGAFRRFKDTLDRVGIAEEWYAYKRLAYIELVREWCDENGLKY